MSHDDEVLCDECGTPLGSFIAGTGICTRCHDRLYGKGHRPTTLRVGLARWLPSCVGKCDVLDGRTLTPALSQEWALTRSKNLHRGAAQESA